MTGNDGGGAPRRKIKARLAWAIHGTRNPTTSSRRNPAPSISHSKRPQSKSVAKRSPVSASTLSSAAANDASNSDVTLL
ncbi:hypothetical protein [Endothiovibrio diazotrophicus]